MSDLEASAQISQSKSAACTVPERVARMRKVRFSGTDSFVSLYQSTSKTQMRSLRLVSGEREAPSVAFQ